MKIILNEKAFHRKVASNPTQHQYVITTHSPTISCYKHVYEKRRVNLAAYSW